MLRQFIFLFFLFLASISWGQNSGITKGGKPVTSVQAKADSLPLRVVESYAFITGKLYEAIIVNGDTIPIIVLPQASAVAKRTFPTKREERKYNKLVAAVKKVLPYAKLAGKRMREVEEELKTLNPKQRKKRLKELEKEIKRDYEGELTKLTFTQGRILIKLLDRETGQVSYDIVKEFRGGFTAWFFQGLAKMFKYDLKAEYDAENDDKLIESIVVKIENGEL